MSRPGSTRRLKFGGKVTKCEWTPKESVVRVYGSSGPFLRVRTVGVLRKTVVGGLGVGDMEIEGYKERGASWGPRSK